MAGHAARLDQLNPTVLAKNQPRISQETARDLSRHRTVFPVELFSLWLVAPQAVAILGLAGLVASFCCWLSCWRPWPAARAGQGTGRPDGGGCRSAPGAKGPGTGVVQVHPDREASEVRPRQAVPTDKTIVLGLPVAQACDLSLKERCRRWSAASIGLMGCSRRLLGPL
jgi:hypothetical protein